MHTYTCTYIHVHTQIHTHAHMYTNTYVHIHTHMYTYTRMHTLTHIDKHMHTQTHVNTYEQMNTHIHTNVHTCIYTHIHTLTHEDTRMHKCAHTYTVHTYILESEVTITLMVLEPVACTMLLNFSLAMFAFSQTFVISSLFCSSTSLVSAFLGLVNLSNFDCYNKSTMEFVDYLELLCT